MSETGFGHFTACKMEGKQARLSDEKTATLPEGVGHRYGAVPYER